MTTLNSIHLEIIYTTLYQTYQLLYCKGHIQITNNHSNVNIETKNNRENKMTIKFNTLRNYTILYQTYQLLYCKRHIEIISNHSNVNMETKNNRVNKMTTFNSIQ